MAIFLRIKDYSLDGKKIDPIQELIKIGAKDKFVQFAKVGRKINEGRLFDIKAHIKYSGEKIFFLKTVKGSISVFGAELHDIDFHTFDSVPFPEYYNKLDEISTWFKISKLVELNPSIIDQYVLEGSEKELRQSMKGMSTVFFVKRASSFLNNQGSF